jgi:pyruvate formate lyase activating enzyme
MPGFAEKKATVFDIQKFSINDGPGIRTTLFFKGCPLRCKWCFSPEGLEPYPQVAVYQKECLGVVPCGRCLKTCPHQDEHILQVNGGIVTGIDRTKCRNCLKCAGACPGGTLKIFGKRYTVKELLDILRADMPFYHETNGYGGGVTITGGDPMTQYDFIRDFMMECRRYGIHTCLESEMQCKREKLEMMLPHADLWITDIKVMDPEKHKQFTGVSNEHILENIEFLVKSGATLIVRTPAVPSYNDDEENIRATAQFVAEKLGNHIAQYQLLPYRSLGMDKYDAFGMEYPLKDLEVPDDKVYIDHLKAMAAVMREYGVPAVVGSYTKL